MPPRKRPPQGYAAEAQAGPKLSAWFEPYARYLTSELGLAANSVAAYSADLKKFFAWHSENGSPPPQSIDLAFLTRYLEHLHGTGLKETSASRHLVSLKMFFRYLVLEGVLAESAVELLTSPKLWNRLPKVLSPERVEALLQAPAATDSFPERDRALLAILYATGCRASEVCDMTLRDIHLEESWCRCVGKGSKERIVHLNPTAVTALTRYLEKERPELAARRNADQLFLTRTGRRLSRIAVWTLVRKYADRSGCRNDVSPHTLRHSFATHMLAGGAEIRALQELLGHANIATTQVYTHVEHSRLKTVHQKFHPRG